MPYDVINSYVLVSVVDLSVSPITDGGLGYSLSTARTFSLSRLPSGRAIVAGGSSRKRKLTQTVIKRMQDFSNFLGWFILRKS